MVDIAVIIAKYRELYLTKRPRLGRWVYCKYCDKHTRPEVGPDYSLVICSVCNYGLAPMDMVCEAGSYRAYHDNLVAEFKNKITTGGL